MRADDMILINVDESDREFFRELSTRALRGRRGAP
jgi:hypothetical protein